MGLVDVFDNEDIQCLLIFQRLFDEQKQRYLHHFFPLSLLKRFGIIAFKVVPFYKSRWEITVIICK